MATYDKDKLLAELERSEARRARIYLDPLGIPTVGVGHALGSTPVPVALQGAFSANAPYLERAFSKAAIDVLLAEDVEAADTGARHLAMLRNVDFDLLDSARQAALVEMSFNLGPTRLGDFTRMWAALAAGQFAEAAREALDSLWARQVGARAQRIAGMIERGGDQP